MCMMYCNDTIYLSILLWIQDTRGSRFVHMRAPAIEVMCSSGTIVPMWHEHSRMPWSSLWRVFLLPCGWLLVTWPGWSCIKIFRHIIYFIQYTYWKQTHFQEKVCGRWFESIARVYKFVIQYCTSGCSCFAKHLSSLAFSNYNMLASCK